MRTPHLAAIAPLASLLALAVGALPARAQAPAASPVVIKIATLAPEGSAWMKLFHAWASGIEKRAPGVKVKFFAGGMAGDEKDVVRKMKVGQVDGGAVTAIGLGLIQPDVRVLEIPFFIKDNAELDFVRTTLDGDFHKMFEDKGYVLLTWGDVGPVHLFSANPLTDESSLSKMKIWAWGDDRLTIAMFDKLQLNYVKLGVPDVLGSLQTGLIDACYGSPLSTLALQWNTKIKYMTSMSISQSIGATLITRKAWDALGPAHQKVVMEESRLLGEKLLQQIRADNTASLEKMKSLGLQVAPTPPALVRKFQQTAEALGPSLDGQVYAGAFRAKVEKLLAERRAGKK